MKNGNEAMGEEWEKSLEPVRKAVVSACLGAITAISHNWQSLTGESRMPLDSRRVLRFEVLAFYLHAMNRFASDAGGDTAKAAIQQYGDVEKVVQEVFTAHLGGTDINGGPEDDWQSWMAEDMLVLAQAADRDYSRFTEFAPNSGLAPFQNSSVTGRLCTRLCHQVGYEESPPLRLFIWQNVLEALDSSKLKTLVIEACQAME